MSDHRGAGRTEHDGKENRRRRQRSEPTCTSSGGWQIASNSRCLACGRLAAMCDCRTTRMDPQLKRQKLDSFLLNTPYVRCKQLKALDDAGREESRHRRRLVEQWGDELEAMAYAALTQQRLLCLALEETAEREALTAVERKGRAEMMVFLDRYVVLFAVVRHEREERLRLCASAQREAKMLLAWHTAVFELISLHSRECAFRDALVNHEAAARSALTSLNVELLNVIDSNERERRAVYGEYWGQREQLVAKWIGGVEAIQSDISMSVSRIGRMMQERLRLFELCEGHASNIDEEEKTTRQHLYGIAVEEGCLVMERLRLCEQQLEAVAQQEAAARAAILQDTADAYNTLFLDFRREGEKALEVEEIKCQEREMELLEAIRHLQSITMEEAAAFASLKAQEHREKDLRYQWMLQKEGQCCELEQASLHQAQLLFDEEAASRHALLSAMQDEEVGIAAWLQHKARKLRELVETAVGQKGDIRLQEHEERFALVSHKAEDEDAVRRWIEQKEIVRQSVIAEEAEHRLNGLEMERAARGEIAWHFDARLEGCRSLVQERIAAQATFQLKALAFLEGITVQETTARLLLQRAAHDDEERALQEEAHRQVLDVLNAETEHRSHMVQQEVRHRESIVTQMLLQKSFFAKEAQELLNARLCEVVAAEEGQRHLLLHLIGGEAERLCLDGRRSFEEAQQRERGRVREELNRRKVALAEDARLYCEDEELTFSHSDAAHHQHQKCTAAQDPLFDESCRLQRQLIAAELGVDEKDVAVLTPTAVAFLVNIVDLITRKDSHTAAELRRAEAAEKEVERKVELQRRQLSSAKERLEELKGKLQRDAAEHERHVAMHRDTRQKDEAQLERERARLQAKVEELRKMHSSVSGMREAIHNQYQKR
ncbi:hypothetical protein DQ04_07651010 [Trypanosoma grayi]|uniref:hypothetical protein n=1 Tax=Trypanosoma grayi TaxID=71804 RepID=UPI0004F43808|nr:hypothetical protein DQ04_07651010 [Trypanosoma grayi]KEG08240.1 hypothetical protein DQ04_07651010 [Trypanosoma grayi]